MIWHSFESKDVWELSVHRICGNALVERFWFHGKTPNPSTLCMLQSRCGTYVARV